MTQRQPRGLSADPMRQWTHLAVKTIQTMMASAQVIGHRTTKMAIAGFAPSASDQEEFTLMGQEKFEAAAESAQAMTMHLIKLNQRLWEQTSVGMVGGASAILSLAGSQTLGQSVERQTDLFNVVSESAKNLSRLAGSSVTLAHRGLRPIHAKATANAKRLGAR
ncbi:polyhydroxyalkanoate granule-associated phasin [Aromatoleum bremense]|uniref:Phasin domain-containing protein n=1 Tax=Aromatoleum bremense TaxID=76115 RepID=A0ABX1NRL5_9RHOO|nr:polyhydroxyalkanoate granule-associated phasin [Aromatoleum bremense]NMG14619.1 hypothetical protein [Aromatoleum bremense]QTQ30536.1 Uncharacterized protein pbN1_05440 [Aromatoleum bremense]